MNSLFSLSELGNREVEHGKGRDVGKSRVVKSLTETAYSYLNNSHSLEYLEFRDAENLDEKEIADNNTIVFIALKIGNVRLIDNIALA